MPKTLRTSKTTSKSTTITARGAVSRRGASERSGQGRQPSGRPPVVVSMGCPCGVGPEVTVGALAKRGAGPAVIAGDRGALEQALKKLGLKLRLSEHQAGQPVRGIQLLQVGDELRAGDRRRGRPGEAAGAAQLGYIEAGYRLARELTAPLVTGPVSKEVIARSGVRGAARFRGHTEWLEELDGADYSVMCFASPKLITALVTTHVPLAKVSRRLSPEAVAVATSELADLVLRVKPETRRPRLAVCAFNPHAGEGGLLGGEETEAIVPGIELAAARVGRRARLEGPIGAETAYRKGAAGDFDAVLAIYHDQATIPMKLLDFGGAVNVTQGLSIVRTSVDHGTAYDIAGKGIASSEGMSAAVSLGRRLGLQPRRIARGPL